MCQENERLRTLRDMDFDRLCYIYKTMVHEGDTFDEADIRWFEENQADYDRLDKELARGGLPPVRRTLVQDKISMEVKPSKELKSMLEGAILGILNRIEVVKFLRENPRGQNYFPEEVFSLQTKDQKQNNGSECGL